MDSLEKRLGYKFTNSLLLAEALTHPSLAYESKRPHFDNQRLEYLGDAVIQLILTDELFTLFPNSAEGKLTKLRSQLVSRTGLCHFARSIHLGTYLLLGKGENAAGGRNRPSILADAFEALIGAIYLDAGFAASRKVMLSNFGDMIRRIADRPVENNPKGQLQEKLQAISASSPKYKIVSQDGPDHQKSFVAEVFWEGRKLGSGSGPSKKEAETAAAQTALGDHLWKAEPKDGENV